MSLLYFEEVRFSKVGSLGFRKVGGDYVEVSFNKRFTGSARCLSFLGLLFLEVYVYVDLGVLWGGGDDFFFLFFYRWKGRFRNLGVR